jgi:hypothetical protein
MSRFTESLHSRNKREKRLAVIIAVPYQHLVDQWDTESQEFGYRPILACQGTASLFDKLTNMVIDFSSGYRDHFAVITTPLSKA